MHSSFSESKSSFLLTGQDLVALRLSSVERAK